MSLVVLDPSVSGRIIRERKAKGLDRYDEVWDGDYIVMPLPNLEHQHLGGRLSRTFLEVVEDPGLGMVFPGCNVSDRVEGWEHNYRCPDVAIYLDGNPARHCGAHWCGGPDLAVEILSPHDRARDKLPFYAGVHTRELLLIDRDPWRLELYRLREGQLALVGTSDAERSEVLRSDVLPLRFRLVAGAPRPQIEIAHADGLRRWTA